MALYDVVDGIYRKVSKKYDPVNGVYRKVKKAYDPVDGVYRQYFSSGPSVGGLAVGDSVWMNVDGVQTEFLVVHQGNPDSALYDASCDGTWLLMKKAYMSSKWNNSASNIYQNSTLHSYLNSTFFDLFDEGTKAQIKQVKIPCCDIDSYNNIGANGVSANIFLLSGTEVGYTHKYLHPSEGAVLSYFSNCTTFDSPKRVAYYYLNTVDWWLRSPSDKATNCAWTCNTYGSCSYSAIVTYLSYYVRPALILDSSTPIDNSTGINIIA